MSLNLRSNRQKSSCHRRLRIGRRAILFVAAATSVARFAYAQSAIWTFNGSASWNTGITGTATLSAGNTGLGNDGAMGTATLALAGGNIFATGSPRVIANPLVMLGNTTVLTGQSVTLNGTIDISGGDRSLNTGNGFVGSQSVTINGSINLSSDGSAHTLSLGGANGSTVI